MNKEEAQAQFKEAAARYHAGDYHGALELLDRLAADAPGNPELEKARERCLRHLQADTRPQAMPPGPASPGDPMDTVPKRKRRPLLRLFFLLLLGGGLAAGAYYGRQLYIQEFVAREVPADDWAAKQEQLLAAHAAARAKREAAEAANKKEQDTNEQAISEFEQKRMKTRENLHAMGVQIHDEREWRPTAVDGLPRWESGTYLNVPCRTKPDFTMDVFIPTSYDSHRHTNFAFLTICMPVPFPSFLGYPKWAEENDVILIVMNHVANYTYEQNFEVQDHVLESVFGTMRLDPRQGLATGSSGGARCSWDMIVRHPQQFSGILLAAMSRGDLGDLPPHVVLAHLHGDQDFNAPHIRKEAKFQQAQGRVYMHQEFPGGHEGGPLELRTQMLDWMLQTLRSRIR